jgi:hypothetical protein
MKVAELIALVISAIIIVTYIVYHYHPYKLI